MNTKKCIDIVNKYITLLNKEEFTDKEFVLILSQLMIQIGRSLYDPNGKLSSDLDWIKLNREYYSSTQEDIGLGLLLNGGQMMGVIDEKQLKQNGDKKDGKISASIENTQKDGRVTVQPKSPRRRGRPRKHKN